MTDKLVEKVKKKVDSRKPSIEIVEGAEQIAKNLTKTRSTRLNEAELTELIVLLAEGATDKRIINVFRKRFVRNISPKTIEKYRMKYRGQVLEQAKIIEIAAIQQGLSKRGTRLRKLQELAEALESDVLDADGELSIGARKGAISEYREVLKLIAQEAGDLAAIEIGDVAYMDMSDEDLKKMVANKLGGNPDLAVQLAEAAGVRPTAPEERETDDNSTSE